LILFTFIVVPEYKVDKNEKFSSNILCELKSRKALQVVVDEIQYFMMMLKNGLQKCKILLKPNFEN